MSGIKVLDFSHYVAGPTCGLVLADLGADVVKVEKAGGGDDLRALGPQLGGVSASFQWANRNKRGIVLDLKSAEGREQALRLAGIADIIIENYSAGVMDRLGLGPDALLSRSPGLIYCSISAYSRSGAYAGRLGFDPVVQAECGLVSITGPEGSNGYRVGSPIADIGSGLFAAIAVLGALAGKGRTGKGQRVEVSLFDSAVNLTALPIMNYLATQVTPAPAGNASREVSPVDFFETQDGRIYLACASDDLFRRMVEKVLDRPDLANDERFTTNARRFANRHVLKSELESELKRKRSADWMRSLLKERIPAGRLNDLSEALTSDEFISRGLLGRALDDSTGLDVPALSLPFRFGEGRSARFTPAPRYGQHTAEVLSEWLGPADSPPR